LKAGYLLDTSAVVALLKGTPPPVRRRFRKAIKKEAPFGVSSVVLHELWHGVARSGRAQENAERLKVFLSAPVRVVPFEAEDAAEAGRLRAELEAAGASLGPYDVLIAAQALRLGATLVTADAHTFERVRGLAWKDWGRKGSGRE